MFYRNYVYYVLLMFIVWLKSARTWCVPAAGARGVRWAEGRWAEGRRMRGDGLPISPAHLPGPPTPQPCPCGGKPACRAGGRTLRAMERLGRLPRLTGACAVRVMERLSRGEPACLHAGEDAAPVPVEVAVITAWSPRADAAHSKYFFLRVGPPSRGGVLHAEPPDRLPSPSWLTPTTQPYPNHGPFPCPIRYPACSN